MRKFARIAATFVGLLLLVMVALIVLNRVEYDIGDPDYAWVEEQLNVVRNRSDGDFVHPGSEIDFSRLNHGDWKLVCAIGGYNDPIKIISKRGGYISSTDRERLKAKDRFPVRLAIVEEFEFMIAYVRNDDSAHFIHFSYGIGSAGQHFMKCIGRPETVIIFA